MRKFRIENSRPVAAALLLMAWGSLACTPSASADPVSSQGAVSLYGDPGRPDVSGLWQGTTVGVPGGRVMSNTGDTADGRPPTYWSPWPLPYTAAFQKISDERVEAAKKGRALGDTGSKCLPFGMPVMLVSQHYPEEIIQTPGEVMIFFFGTFPVTVWTDGRSHPRDLVPSYNGHSIGHWVGDTLFVDTVGILGVTPIDSGRDPHSPELHLAWTMQRVASDFLHVHLTMYDKDAFAQPVTITSILQRKNGPEWQLLDDASCFENNQDVPLPAKDAGFIKF